MSHTGSNLTKNFKSLLDRHSKDHSHDVNKAFTLYVGVLANLLKNIVLLADRGNRQASGGIFIIFTTTALLIAGTNSSQLLHKICVNVKTGMKLTKEKSSLTSQEATDSEEDTDSEVLAQLQAKWTQHKESWLITISQFLVTLGTLSYYVGDNLPSFTTSFSTECDRRCVGRATVAGAFFLFLALTFFTFIPEIFSRINGALDPNHTPGAAFITREQYHPVQRQWLIIRVMALTLNFDTIYSGLWTTAAFALNNCDGDIIAGSVVSILVGWATWSIYTGCYSYYLRHVRETTTKFFELHKELGKWHVVLEYCFYGSLMLFLVSYFPIHMLADNDIPISCSCNSNFGASNGTDVTCLEPVGALATRVVLLSYETILLTALGILAVIKYNTTATMHI